MNLPSEQVHLTKTQINEELVPALENWDRRLDELGVKRLAWFLFGSVVVKDQVGDNSVNESPTQALAAALAGVRPSNIFRPVSDIDVGLVVADGHDEIYINQDNPLSLFRATRVAGHILSLTRFESSWVERRLESIEKLSQGTPYLRSYGKIVPLELALIDTD